jgi:hypothetical protein
LLEEHAAEIGGGFLVLGGGGEGKDSDRGQKQKCGQLFHCGDLAGNVMSGVYRRSRSG